MCKPILPLVLDEIAHIFWKTEHLATVHHHHGDHHAEVEIGEAEHEENDKQPATTKILDPVSVHINVKNLYGISQPTIRKQQFAVNSCNVSTVSLDKYYPPPKCC